MDASTIRRALYDFFRFNPKDFIVSASGVGYMISAARPRQASLRYAFYSQYADSATGNRYLQGGYVLAGDATIWVDDILLYDGTTAEWEGIDGDLLWIALTGDGVVVDSVVLPGFNGTAATTAIGTAAPANTIPAYDDAAGLLHIVLGQFSATGFIPVAPGNINVGFCPGTFSTIRDILSDIPAPP